MVLHVGDYTGAKGHLEAIQIFSRAHVQNAVLVMVSSNFGQIRISVPIVMEEILRSLLGRNTNKAHIEKLEIARLLAMPGNQYNHKRILFTSLSRKETVAAFQAADLFLFPSNIECSPIVLFESAASRTPFLSSDAGNAGEIARWTGGGMILPTSHKNTDLGLIQVDVNGSARILETFWRDRSRGKAMGEAAFKAWKRQFTWERITDQYESLYANLLKI